MDTCVRDGRRKAGHCSGRRTASAVLRDPLVPFGAEFLRERHALLRVDLLPHEAPHRRDEIIACSSLGPNGTRCAPRRSIDSVARHVEQGYKAVCVQCGIPGMPSASYAVPGTKGEAGDFITDFGGIRPKVETRDSRRGRSRRPA